MLAVAPVVASCTVTAAVWAEAAKTLEPLTTIASLLNGPAALSGLKDPLPDAISTTAVASDVHA